MQALKAFVQRHGGATKVASFKTPGVQHGVIGRTGADVGDASTAGGEDFVDGVMESEEGIGDESCTLAFFAHGADESGEVVVALPGQKVVSSWEMLRE